MAKTPQKSTSTGKDQDTSLSMQSFDSVSFNDTSQAAQITNDTVDPITQAIRDEVISKQMGHLQDWFAEKAIDEEEKKKIQKYDPQQFREFLNNNKDKTEEAFKDKDLANKLNQAEVKGYNSVNQKFKDQFSNVEWDGASTATTRSQEVKDKSGKVIATLTEKTSKASQTIKSEDGHNVKIESCRSIDFPIKLNASGPMHVQMAVKDEKGNNIAADKAVYFTAHYDNQGKLTEVSAPMPVKFTGKGDDAIGYIEREGKIYTLPVTQGKYKEMMKEVAINQGMNVDISQSIENGLQKSTDKIITPEHLDKKVETTIEKQQESKTIKSSKIQELENSKKINQISESPDSVQKPEIVNTEKVIIGAHRVKGDKKAILIDEKKDDLVGKDKNDLTANGNVKENSDAVERKSPKIPPVIPYKPAFLQAKPIIKAQETELQLKTKDPQEQATKIRTSLERPRSNAIINAKQSPEQQKAILTRPKTVASGKETGGRQ